MSLIEAASLYNDLIVNEFNWSLLERKIKELEKEKVDYNRALKEIVTSLNKKYDVSLSINTITKKSDYLKSIEDIKTQLEQYVEGKKKDKDELEIGDIVIHNSCQDRYWKQDYLQEREKNFPVGSRGKIIENEGSDNIYVAFEDKKEIFWPTNWFRGTGINKKNIAQYSIGELAPLEQPQKIKEELENFKDKKEAINLIVSKERSYVENKLRIQDYEIKRGDIMRNVIRLMVSQGYKKQDILTYFKKRLSDNPDVEKLL